VLLRVLIGRGVKMREETAAGRKCRLREWADKVLKGIRCDIISPNFPRVIHHVQCDAYHNEA
jgi:hypothetical protein